jgi:hypothetical protein
LGHWMAAKWVANSVELMVEWLEAITAVQKVLHSADRKVDATVEHWVVLKVVLMDCHLVEQTGHDLVDLWVLTKAGHLACWWVELRGDTKVEHSAVHWVAKMEYNLALRMAEYWAEKLVDMTVDRRDAMKAVQSVFRLVVWMDAMKVDCSVSQKDGMWVVCLESRKDARWVEKMDDLTVADWDFQWVARLDKK